MSTFWLTFILSIVVVFLALATLGISWLVTGKSKIIRGACGMDPHKLRNKKCGTSDTHCGLCESSPSSEKKPTSPPPKKS